MRETAQRKDKAVATDASSVAQENRKKLIKIEQLQAEADSKLIPSFSHSVCYCGAKDNHTGSVPEIYSFVPHLHQNGSLHELSGPCKAG